MATTIEDVLAVLAKNAKRMRGDRTQADLAEASGLTVSQISQIESGRPENPPSVRTLVALANGLGVDVSELLKRAAG
ncbi:helix-turn-helix protein [Gemmata obscuriglobus]|uniref:XRE family transcriptional regulator n=1 Tax=Gemmata obscuriglobus TaxID=114 RepID=A0A2Z3H6P5_9BACT|nr:helix-turn-helix transcriptional regulator [Gemmata obscuriglobus]AWM38695.1 XRE family transcriptional regulator [Gemmata obscuriglobus]QEG28339.1 helix-turn-helix protein [Gemmata obscuriglobus]VTS06215.1 hypothetical protein : : HTH_3 [Gemmata obscuriglobus UQM 2246]